MILKREMGLWRGGDEPKDTTKRIADIPVEFRKGGVVAHCRLLKFTPIACEYKGLTNSELEASLTPLARSQRSSHEVLGTRCSIS